MRLATVYFYLWFVFFPILIFCTRLFIGYDMANAHAHHQFNGCFYEQKSIDKEI